MKFSLRKRFGASADIPYWIEKIVEEYKKKKEGFISEGRTLSNPEYKRILDVLDWGATALASLKPPKTVNEFKMQKENFESSIKHLKELGVFEKYMKK